MLTGTHFQFSHAASCPEISPVDCEQFDIIDHEHHQTMLLMRFQPTFSIGLGRGWQTMVRVPYDIKQMRIEYTDLQGNPYDPPYGNIHHRNETLTGLGDSELEIQYFWSPRNKWVVGGGLGSTLPFGRTEEAPYLRASRSLKHQHIQMGSGAFNPILSATVVWSAHRWGFSAQTTGKLALYENSKDYRASSTVQMTLGPTYRFTSKLMFLTHFGIQRDWQAEWSGEPDPLSGRSLATAGASVIQRFTPKVAIMGQLRATIFQHSVADTILQPMVGSIGVSVTPAGNKK